MELNQELWHTLRSMNQKNANMAAELDERIISTRTVAEKQLTSIQDLNVSLAVLPSIVDQLKHCTEMIEEISSSMCDVEGKLTQLEDLVEVLNLQERQLDSRFEMAMYKEKKMAELDLVRERLAKEHADNVGRHEKGMRKVQQERQLVFQDAFQDDLKYYKETGSIPSEADQLRSHEFEKLFIIPSFNFRSDLQKSTRRIVLGGCGSGRCD